MEAIHWMIRKSRQVMFDRQYTIYDIVAGRYEIHKVLRNGSYGIIYLCRDIYSNQKCVVKQMRKSKKKENKKNYKQETTCLSLLDHPSIPKILDIFSYQNNQFFSMEYIEGRNLEDTLFDSKKQYSEKECVRFVRELTSILDYIHGKGIIHGDLRIPNVIINKDSLYLIDFGLAHTFDTDNLAKKQQIKLVQEDFFDLGEFFLFLLYSSYQGNTKKDRPWTEELKLHDKTTSILKRLLQIDEAYYSSKEIIADLNSAIKCFS